MNFVSGSQVVRHDPHKVAIRWFRLPPRATSLPTIRRGVAATVKIGGSETGTNHGGRFPLPARVGTFAGRGGLQPASLSKGPIGVEASMMVGKTGYVPAEDSCLVPRPTQCSASEVQP